MHRAVSSLTLKHVVAEVIAVLFPIAPSAAALIPVFLPSARYDEDKAFEQPQANIIQSVDLTDGTWYIKISGDYAGKVSGIVYNIDDTEATSGAGSSEAKQPEEIKTDVSAVARAGLAGYHMSLAVVCFRSVHA